MIGLMLRCVVGLGQAVLVQVSQLDHMRLDESARVCGLGVG